ncbi:glutamate--tRNA ligase [Rubrobacter marinus]|uniref:Glutamate--tRNA ligase n=1 Tax=Rubrobacter marinus TaxID=2653852 RepID=A0A6G8PV31_9ACTN|nr:glutamate--tRNA ligase family protein [Rubrobacter marinus]QIN78062.1 glutamate--tRNA ligase [Rubrobacter marinus]
MEDGKVRVRFAPSPTGMLHLGGARTALFNYLFARYQGGDLVLRVDDTDRERSTRGFEAAQLEDLEWLGLGFDEGPYRQSERGDVYDAAVEKLAEAGLVYRAEDEAGRRALYFRPREREGSYRDALRGEIPFSRVEDFVLVKSDGTPAYNFAAVADDAEMGITHVLRGEEHLSNTARQVLLYRALGEGEPEFLHLGLILAPDGAKLSKRHGARSVAEHRREGYLPGAIIEHLATLGWSHPAGREEFDGLEELAQEWDPSRLGASPAIFDPDRLLQRNARRIRALPAGDLLRRLEPFLDEPPPEGRELLAVEAIKEEMRVLSDAPRLVREITDPVDPRTFARELTEASVGVYARAEEVLEGRRIEGWRMPAESSGSCAPGRRGGDEDPRPLASPAARADGVPQRAADALPLRRARGRESRERIKRAREARLGHERADTGHPERAAGRGGGERQRGPLRLRADRVQPHPHR